MNAAPAWRVAGSSVAGACHANDDCQDRHRVLVTPGGMLIAVVSDGAGSARFGADGAALLCDRVVESLSVHFGHREPSAALLAGAPAAIEAGIALARAVAGDVAAEQGVGLEAFHATLVGALMAPGVGGLFFHIGDGAALAIAGEGARWALSPPSNGEYADTTFFFTEEDWRDKLRFLSVDPEFDTVFVMSDGVTDLGLKQNGDGAAPFMPFFEPIARFLSQASREEGETALKATLDSSAVRERTSDDKTLVWAQAAR